MTSPPLLVLKDVRRAYRRGPEVVEALRGACLEVGAGRIVGVVGASGSGKTTLLNIAGGVDRPTSGTVNFQGNRIDTLSEGGLTDLRRRHIGMIFQEFHLVGGLTAVQNVRLPLMFSRDSASAGGGARATELLEITGIGSRASFRPHQLSGGEQQRVAIARALIRNPELLLADEPTGNLDSHQASTIMDLFRSLVRTTGLAVLLATHDEALAAQCDLSHRLKDGVLTPRG